MGDRRSISIILDTQEKKIFQVGRISVPDDEARGHFFFAYNDWFDSISTGVASIRCHKQGVTRQYEQLDSEFSALAAIAPSLDWNPTRKWVKRGSNG